MALEFFRVLFFVFIIKIVSCGWVKVWEDQFNGNKLNESNWRYEEGCDGWGNNELECYTVRRHQNARVENGNLVIHVNVESFNGKHYTSARLNSKQSWAYGKFEARAKLPKGKHLWPAIWMMPEDETYGSWPASGEIDIMELRGQIDNQIEATISFGGEDPNYVSRGSDEVKFPFDFSADFHMFGLEWDHNEIRWYCDEKMYHKESINRNMWSGKGHNPYTKYGQPFDKPFYWIFNVAVGGDFFKEKKYGNLTIDEAKHWQKPTMEIDYVRVYEYKD